MPANPGSQSVHALIHQTLLGDALQFAALAAFVLDEAGNYVAVNDAACTLSGYSREELVGLRAGRDLTADPGSEAVYEHVTGSDRAQGTARLRRSDGSVVAVNYLTMQTTVSSLPYVLSLCWPADD